MGEGGLFLLLKTNVPEIPSGYMNALFIIWNVPNFYWGWFYHAGAELGSCCWHEHCWMKGTPCTAAPDLGSTILYPRVNCSTPFMENTTFKTQENSEMLNVKKRSCICQHLLVDHLVCFIVPYRLWPLSSHHLYSWARPLSIRISLNYFVPVWVRASIAPSIFFCLFSLPSGFLAFLTIHLSLNRRNPNDKPQTKISAAQGIWPRSLFICGCLCCSYTQEFAPANCC